MPELTDKVWLSYDPMSGKVYAQSATSAVEIGDASDLEETLSQAFKARDDIRNIFVDALSPGAPQLVKVGFQYDDGRIVPVIGANDKLVVMRDDGTFERAVSPENRWGDLAFSSGVFDGEVLTRAFVDEDGRVREAFGHKGGHFVYANGALRRANANATGGAYPQLTYTAEPFTAGAGTNERLHYIDGLQTTTALIRVVLGQSNANGQNTDTGDALVAGAAVYPGKALMLPGGPRAQTSSNGALIDLVEVQITEGGATQKDTPLSGWVNHLIRDINAKFGFQPTVAGLVSATGGQPYLGLKRGSTAYKNLLARLKDLVAQLKSLGFTAFQTSVAWVGSETDATDTTLMTPSRMAYQLQQLSRQLNGDIKAITGETEDIVLFTVQPGNVRTGWDKWEGNFVREGFRVANRRDNIVLVGGAYQTGMSDGIHRDNIGKLIIGQNIAMADIAENFGGGWHFGLQDHSQAAGWLSSTECYVDLDFMGTAPVLDTSEAMVVTSSDTDNAALANAGFHFEDDSGSAPTITGVTISGKRVVITLSGPSSGPRPRMGYAIQRTGSGSFATYDGGTYGARGILRDNQGSVSLYDASTQYCWFPAFIVQLPARF